MATNKLAPRDLNSLNGAFFGNPMLQRQVARTRALQAGRSNDVNTLPDPRTYAAVMGLMGTAPDEMGFSALHPDLAGIKQAAEPAYALGTAAAMAPIMQALAQSRIARQALMSGGKAIAPQIERYMAKQGMMPGVIEQGAKTLQKIDEATGLPLNPDGTVTLFHHTNKDAAKKIQDTGVMKSAGEPSVYFTTERTPTTGYGDSIVEVRVNPRKLNLDDEFPNGRMDFSMDTGKPGGSVKVKPVQPFIYPRQAALDTAQRNAALPVEQGGLGLAAGNTPMERAAIMFPDEGFHGTPDNRLSSSRQFKDEMLGKSTQVADAAKGHYSATTGDAASEYIWRHGSTEGGNVLPLQLSGNRATVNLPGEWQPGRFDNAIDQVRAAGYEGLNIQGTTTLGKPGDYQVTFNPANIRSRFAAFDPFQRNSPDILAGALPLTALSDEDMRNQMLKFARRR